MAKSDCETILGLIPLYIDNMLSDVETDTVREHIESCPACREEYHFLESILKSAATLPPVQVSEHFHSTLMDKIKAEGAVKPVPKKRYNLRRAFAGVAAAAAVVALSVVSYLNLDSDLQSANPDAFIQNPVATQTPDGVKTGEIVTGQPANVTEPQTAEPTQPNAPATQLPKQETKPHTTAAPAGDQTPKTATPGQQTNGTPADNGKADVPTPAAETPFAAEPANQNPVPAGHGGGGGGNGASSDAEKAPRDSAQTPRSGGGSSAVAYTADGEQTTGTVFYVTVSEDKKDAAEAMLNGFEKDATGYLVGEKSEEILKELSVLEGYSVTAKPSSAEADYIVLQ